MCHGLLLLSAVTLTGALACAQDDAVFRSDVQLVRILATVKDSSGALVGSLDKNDFEVRDNGAPQQVSVFERQTDQPLSVAVLIDNSGSTAKDLRFEIDSVTRFLHALVREGNPRDAVSLYSFNWEIVKYNGFTRNVSAVEHSLRALKGEAGTSLYDAILLASRDIEDRPGRKVLVIVTDGGDTTSHTDFERATEAAQIADAVIYPVLVVPITNEVGRNIGGENALTTLARRTGGRVFEPSLGAALDRAFDQILRDLRTQYLLGYYPRAVPLTKERFHSLEIAVRQPGLQIKARNGYYGETRQSGASEGSAGEGSVGARSAGPARVESVPGSDSVRPPRPPATQTNQRRISQN
ncbi:MAG: VWA domain-containing protein [Acidobacteriota bacterium]|nr:VWA domain-containing protein [Acidobacteriota bacterium]